MRIPNLVPWSRWLLFIAGMVALAYVGLALLDERLYQASESRRFEQELKDVRSPNVNLPLPPVEEAKPSWSGSFGLSGSGHYPLGRIQIGAIGLSAMILEGIDGRTLRRGVGHVPGTPLPGQLGNVALAGHRDTFFRALRNISKGDEISIETLSGLYRYRVDSTRVVDAGEMRVLDRSDGALLTLVTCYPFSFVGPAPKRFVVRAYELATTATGPASAGAAARQTGHSATGPQGMR